MAQWAKLPGRVLRVLGLRRLLWGCALLVALPPALLVLTAALISWPTELDRPATEVSLRLEDRNGGLLREVLSSRGAQTRWLAPNETPEFLQSALVAVEDRRFHSHPGVDALAVLRAVGQWVRHGRIISGASTLTMQLARNVRPRPRTLRGKWGEMALALKIEWRLSKQEILTAYLNRIDFGPNLRGVAASSHSYFGRAPMHLSMAQQALLAGLAQGPSAYALRAHPERALDRRKRVLQAMVDHGDLTVDRADELASEPLELVTRSPAFGAPHFTTSLLGERLAKVQPQLRALQGASRARTTLDPDLQRVAEVAVVTNLEQLQGHAVNQAAALLVDNTTGDVLAYVGSPDFYAPGAGQVDGVLARRQPGSTLKPFVYAAAMQELGYTSASVLEDLELSVPAKNGSYSPRNYDNAFRGPVRLREALANSVNVPAVRTAMALGPRVLLDHLRALGFGSLDQDPDYYGPALALGDGEVSLLELVRAYACLARDGQSTPLRFLRQIEDATGVNTFEASALGVGRSEQVLPRATAALIGDILRDPRARAETFGRSSALEFEFDVAVKTGTSKGYRDNWVVGYTRKYTLGAWVGNFDGSPMQRVGGAAGAAPIFRTILLAATGRHTPEPLPLSNATPDELDDLDLQQVEICPLSGHERSEACPRGVLEWIPKRAPLRRCDWHRRAAIDTSNGLLAGPSCPSRQVQARVFEVFPPEYEAWAHAGDHPELPSVASPNCPLEAAPSNEARSLEISAPADGARFVIDPDHARQLQALPITVRVRGTRSVRLQIDAQPPIELPAPFRYFWQLEPGPHQFVALDDTGEQSEPVHVYVREVNER